MGRGRTERGATAVEYSVLVGLVVAVIILAVSFLGSGANDSFECAGSLYAGTTCVEGTRFEEGGGPPDCKSKNRDPGQGCFGK